MYALNLISGLSGHRKHSPLWPDSVSRCTASWKTHTTQCCQRMRSHHERWVKTVLLQRVPALLFVTLPAHQQQLPIWVGHSQQVISECSAQCHIQDAYPVLRRKVSCFLPHCLLFTMVNMNCLLISFTLTNKHVLMKYWKEIATCLPTALQWQWNRINSYPLIALGINLLSDVIQFKFWFMCNLLPFRGNAAIV